MNDPVIVKLSTKFFKEKYASPYIVDLKDGDKIQFTTDSTKGFRILIDNSDEIFGAKEPDVSLTVMEGQDQKTPAIKLKGELQKYYSIYSLDKTKYADYPGFSPPKIVGM